MLPILKKKEQSVSSPIIKHRTPDDKTDLSNHEEDQSDSALTECAKYLLYGIETRDHKAIAKALQDAIECLGQSTDKEDEPEYNPEPHSYEAQNKSAASKRVIG